MMSKFEKMLFRQKKGMLDLDVTALKELLRKAIQVHSTLLSNDENFMVVSNVEPFNSDEPFNDELFEMQSLIMAEILELYMASKTLEEIGFHEELNYPISPELKMLSEQEKEEFLEHFLMMLSDLSAPAEMLLLKVNQEFNYL